MRESKLQNVQFWVDNPSLIFKPPPLQLEEKTNVSCHSLIINWKYCLHF